ncbi:MAG: DUF616 domain-containing protein [Candidatus Eremiobacteraeota bacterium]|nr:DUF616 domain-containing protein [Candidatus Eremiobacteraeota bacterium]
MKLLSYRARPWLRFPQRSTLAVWRPSPRYCKLWPHRCLPEHDFSLWLGPGIQVSLPAEDANWAEGVLGSCNLAVLPHPYGASLWDEFWQSIHEGKERSSRLYEQMARYHLSGYPESGPLYDTSLILRRNNQRNQEFSREWWQETERSSLCENLSFHWVCHKMK